MTEVMRQRTRVRAFFTWKRKRQLYGVKGKIHWAEEGESRLDHQTSHSWRANLRLHGLKELRNGPNEIKSGYKSRLKRVKIKNGLRHQKHATLVLRRV